LADARFGSSLFPDADLVDYVGAMYGPVMAAKCGDIFSTDPQNECGLAQNIRRSLTRELDEALQNGWTGE
jgi:hypothetical protein